MIKSFLDKFLICLFLLVTIFSVASSCYAEVVTLDNFQVISLKDYGITLDDVKNYADSRFADDISPYFENGVLAYKYGNNLYFQFYKMSGDSLPYGYLKFQKTDYIVTLAYSSDGSRNTDCYYLNVTFDVTTMSFTSAQTGSTSNPGRTMSANTIIQVLDCTTFLIYYWDSTHEDVLVYDPNEIDMSFDYSFEGIKRGQVKLTINNLNPTLKMFGYVDLQNTLSVGDIFDSSLYVDNLRLLATKTDNSDLYCYLFEGEELFYYIVDENNKILDVGSITEMANGYFLYGFNVYDGVDFVFLKDGQVYWDNNLVFKYSLSDSNLVQNNDIVSMGSSSYIISDKTIANGVYNGFVYDSNSNLLCSSDVSFSNDLTSPLSIEVDTSYYEDNLGFNEGVWCIYSITLSGTNSVGDFIDFSNYSVRWSIPTNIEINSVRIGSEQYDKRNGTFTGFSSAGYLPCYLYIRDYVSSWKPAYVPFDITLQVYNENGDLVLTHVINSNEIVSDKIASDENNVDKDDFEIEDNPGYDGGSSTPNTDNIQDWTVEDYTDLMSTDNFVWEFFKAILGNLPWWITVPLTILIFGVVIITLIRFARGA